MNINRNNYEAYFIDYLEGNLDESLVDSFIDFIKRNPDLKEELELFESVSVEPEAISFSKKDKLYKEKFDSENEFNNAAIATLEGDISEDEKQEFDSYLAAHPEKQKEAALFSKTILKADQSIHFGKKQKLYKKPLGKTILLWSGRVAAILIIGLAIFTLIEQDTEQNLPETTLVENIEKPVQNIVQEEIINISPERKELEEKDKNIEKPEIKKVIPQKKETTSIQQNTVKEPTQNLLAAVRTPVEVPDEINAIAASIEVPQTQASLASMYLSYPDEYYGDEWLLADEVKEKVNFGKITKAGLKFIANLSNDRFKYETDTEGKVTEYNYDSKLLAFSIPANRTKSE